MMNAGGRGIGLISSHENWSTSYYYIIKIKGVNDLIRIWYSVSRFELNLYFPFRFYGIRMIYRCLYGYIFSNILQTCMHYKLARGFA